MPAERASFVNELEAAGLYSDNAGRDDGFDGRGEKSTPSGLIS